MGQAIITAVTPVNLHKVWAVVGEHLEPSIEYSNGEFDLINVFENIMTGNHILLMAFIDQLPVASILITKIIFPSGKAVLHVQLVGGSKMPYWGPALHTKLEEIAIEQGCSHIQGSGRSEWTDIMKSAGYELIHTTISKRVGE